MNGLFLLACAFGCIALTLGQDASALPVANPQLASATPVADNTVVPVKSLNAEALGYSNYQRPSVYSNLGLSTGYTAPEPTRPVAYNQNQNQNQNQNDAYVQQGLSAVDASRQLIAAAITQGANPNNFGVRTNAHYNIASQPNPQNPIVWEALDALRGRNALTIDEILNILAYAVAGKDYPIYNEVPNTRFSCEKVHQAGFYADTDAACQVIRRCDINGVMWSFLCPNMTLFNQITLVCDWFFNVNCNNAVRYYDYSNPRLYTQFDLLDTPRSNAYPAPGPVRPSNNYPVPAPPRPQYPQPTVYRS
jgi:hypothetical protein